MSIITNLDNKSNKQNTYLKIVFKEDVGDDFGNVLPYPNKHYIDTNFTYYWLISGYFDTKKSWDYINDIKSRFLITYKDKIKTQNHYKTNDFINVKELKEFQKLKSISINIINNTNRFDSTKDFVFWCIKLYCESIIETRGIVTYDDLLEFSIKNFSDKKDFSTIKSKCRSIINYYIEKDYRLDRYKRKLTDEELSMSRSENMTKIRNKIKKDNTKKVVNFLSGMFSDEYKKPNGEWNISLISKNLNLSRPTIYRIIKDSEI